MTGFSAKHAALPLLGLLALSFAAEPASAQFAAPVQLANTTAMMASVVPLSAGPDSLAVWVSTVDGHYAYQTRTAGTWSAPGTVSNAFTTVPNCCEGLHPYGAGNAALVFSNAGGTFESDFAVGVFGTPASVATPSFQNGSTFLTNANGDAAVISMGSDLRVVRRSAGSTVWGPAETIPTPTIAPDSAATIGNAALGANGELVVSFTVKKTDCVTKCGLTLYAATETLPGSGWKLSRNLAPHAAGNTLVSQPFVDATGHAGIAYVQQFGQTLELNAAIQLKPTLGWRAPVTIVSQPLKQGRKRSAMTLFGAETDAAGHATIVFGTGTLGVSGQTVWTVDGNSRKNIWNTPTTLATSAASQGVHFASNTVGGIALAWDNPDAPISVLTRATTASGWGSVQSVGSPSCSNGTTICTQVLSLSTDDAAKQRLLYNDSTNNPGSLYYAETP